MKVFVFFNGNRVGAFLDFVDAIKKIRWWLNPISNFEIFNPITFVIK